MSTINILGNALSGQSGTGTFVGKNSPTLVGPALGAATATSLTFGGTLLQTYATGTSWTPTFTCATPGNLSVSYATRTGTYTKVGQIVFIEFDLVCTPTFTTAAGNIIGGSLPFSAAVTQSCINVSNVSAGFTWPVGNTSLNWQTSAASSGLFLVAIGSASNSTGLAITTVVSGVQISISGSGIYYTTSA